MIRDIIETFLLTICIFFYLEPIAFGVWFCFLHYKIANEII